VVHPLDDEADTRSRLDLIEHDLSRITRFIDKAEPWVEEWIGRGDGDHGIRGQVMEALAERRAAKAGARIFRWVIGTIGAGAAAVYALVHEIFKR